MKKNLALSILLAVGLASSARAQAPASPAVYTLQAGSSLWITGNSTLHPWGSTATLVALDASFASDKPSLAAVERGALKALTLAITVKGLKSGEGGLDKNMYKAMKESSAPEIRFKLVDYTTRTAKSGDLEVLARGALSIAGSEKEVVVPGTVAASPDGVSVRGSYELLMSDFGVKPPTLMFGAIKVADKVVVHFDLKLKASGLQAPKTQQKEN